jgi:hypothetical protein
MIPSAEFIAWVQQQTECRLLRTHIHLYILERGLTPTRQEVKSLANNMYNKLRQCVGRDYPMIDYTPVSRPSKDGITTIKFSEARDLSVVTDAIEHNGFALAQTTSALEDAHSTHATATVAQQKSLGGVVKTMTQEIAILDLKLNNTEEIARRDRELAADRAAQLEEARRDKVWLQSMISKRGGNNVV